MLPEALLCWSAALHQPGAVRQCQNRWKADEQQQLWYGSEIHRGLWSTVLKKKKHMIYMLPKVVQRDGDRHGSCSWNYTFSRYSYAGQVRNSKQVQKVSCCYQLATCCASLAPEREMRKLPPASATKHALPNYHIKKYNG